MEVVTRCQIGFWFQSTGMTRGSFTEIGKTTRDKFWKEDEKSGLGQVKFEMSFEASN